MKKRTSTLKMVLSALFLALAYIMPYITGQIPEFGSMLCPMHIPVLLCGFICGWQWGLLVGFASPLFRSAIASMPPMFPTAICMAFELSTYGAVAGIMYRLLPKKKINVYVSLLTSMLVGRIVWGCAMLIALGLNGKSFGLTAFIAGAFTEALPGIAAQIILVPVIVIVIEMQNIFKEKQHK